MIFGRRHPRDVCAIALQGDAGASAKRARVQAVRNPLGRVWSWLAVLDARLLDGGLSILLAVGAGLQLLAEEPGNLGRLLPVLGTCLPLVVRRRYPIVGHALQILSAIATQRQPVSISLVAIFIGVYSVAVYSRWRVT